MDRQRRRTGSLKTTVVRPLRLLRRDIKHRLSSRYSRTGGQKTTFVRLRPVQTRLLYGKLLRMTKYRNKNPLRKRELNYYTKPQKPLSSKTDACLQPNPNSGIKTQNDGNKSRSQTGSKWANEVEIEAMSNYTLCTNTSRYYWHYWQCYANIYKSALLSTPFPFFHCIFPINYLHTVTKPLGLLRVKYESAKQNNIVVRPKNNEKSAVNFYHDKKHSFNMVWHTNRGEHGNTLPTE